MFGFFSSKRREEEKRRRDAVRAELAGGARYRDRADTSSSGDGGYSPALYGGLGASAGDCTSSSSDSRSSCSSSDGGGGGGGGD